MGLLAFTTTAAFSAAGFSVGSSPLPLLVQGSLPYAAGMLEKQAAAKEAAAAAAAATAATGEEKGTSPPPEEGKKTK